MKKWDNLSPASKYAKHMKNPERYPITDQEIEEYRQYFRDYYHHKGDKQKRKKRSATLREKAISTLGSKCMICGSADSLQIHHLDEDMDTSKATRTRHIEIINGSHNKKIVLLCNHHHRIFHSIRLKEWILSHSVKEFKRLKDMLLNHLPC